jgi:3-phenylpropionate/cinnamic acid dioxygenase small subunit
MPALSIAAGAQLLNQWKPKVNSQTIKLTPELQLSLEQFYFLEARLLDARQYQQWLGLLSEDIQYVMPSRVNVQVDNQKKGQEDMISVERELETVDSDGCPVREESFIHLSVRVDRAYKMNSWSENPPARTRRLIGNVELISAEGDKLTVYSNFHLYYARPGSKNFIYSGQRRDTLLQTDDSYKIGYREVIMDYANIDVPTLGLLF